MHMQTRPCRGSKATPGADKALNRLECCCGSSFCFDPCLSLGDECAISSSRLHPLLYSVVAESRGLTAVSCRVALSNAHFSMLIPPAGVRRFRR